MQEQIEEARKALLKIDSSAPQSLAVNVHSQYLSSVIDNMGQSIIKFDCAQPWVLYYLVHSKHILKRELKPDEQSRLINHLRYTAIRGPPLQQILGADSSCLKTGGFAGSVNQLPHLATTYAGFLAVLELGPIAYPLLNRESLTEFFWKCKRKRNFIMHQLGEQDLRAAYIVTMIVRLLHLDPALLEGVAQTIVASQSYEGGISNTIGGQAHGGYTYCGVAALAILGKLQMLDLGRLGLWLSQRQTQIGGFNGRTNKLVDSCYSHWVGNIFNILNLYFEESFSLSELAPLSFLYSQQELQNYLLKYCQDLKKGGLRDKPGKLCDIYHTCYSLSGLCNNQWNQSFKLEEVHPFYNVTESKIKMLLKHFDT